LQKARLRAVQVAESAGYEGDSVVLAAVLQAIVATTEMRRTYERQTGCNIAAATR